MGIQQLAEVYTQIRMSATIEIITINCRESLRPEKPIEPCVEFHYYRSDASRRLSALIVLIHSDSELDSEWDSELATAYV